MKKILEKKGVKWEAHVIYNRDQLFEYISTIASKIFSHRVSQWMKSPEEDEQMTQLYHLYRIPGLLLSAKLTSGLWEACENHFAKSNRALVFNDKGGYGELTDDIKVLEWTHLHPVSKVVVLENDKKVDKEVEEYLKANHPEHLLLNNLYTYSAEEVFYYCSHAEVIVFKTQALPTEQYVQLMKMASQLSPKTIVVINSPSFDVTDEHLQKHTIICK